MIGYVCKYTPVELLTALGAEPVRIQPACANFDLADACMHANVCSFAKAALEDIAVKDYEGIVLTTCCDSIRRLRDVLACRFPEKFLFMLDVPRVVSASSIRLFARDLKRLVAEFQAFSGNLLRRECLAELLVSQNPAASGSDRAPRAMAPRVGLLGARHDESLSRVIEDAGIQVGFDLTCVGGSRTVAATPEELGKLEGPEGLDEGALIDLYADRLLRQVPCLRMWDAGGREAFLGDHAGEVDGLVYHTVKFCDLYSYEYAHLHRRSNIPVLKIETDATSQSSGQIQTRVEAFGESLRAAKKADAAPPRRPHSRRAGACVLGIDSGSTSTNAAIVSASGELVASEVIRTGARAGESARAVLGQVLAKAGLERDDLGLIVATGYGRVSVDFADVAVTEISCHGKGAWFFDPDVRTILDIGGQDSKAIRLEDNGEVADFAMNDKCAAGTGRFLEAMARTLECDITELGALSLSSKHEVEISSMCTVFAESEVIGLIANDVDKADIAHGVHVSIAGRAFSLLRRVGLEPAYMMTGGVANNPGVVAELERLIGARLRICDNPAIVGAVGAAVCGLERLAKN